VVTKTTLRIILGTVVSGIMDISLG